jgi:putative ABC transport system permease protein
LQVKGVYKDFSRQASFYKNVQFIASFDYYVSTLPNKDNVLQGWNQNMFTVYVNLKPSYTFEQVSSAIKDMAAPFETDIRPEVFIHPMSKWHLHNTFKNGKNIGGFISIVRLFLGVGLGILLLVVFNFVNLTTAHNMNRTREVGIRKAIGASRRSLIYQFLLESFLYVLISGILAICLAFLSAPLFDKFGHIVISINFVDYRLVSIYCAVLLVSVVLGGFYPAFYLSSFAAVNVLKGQAIVKRKNILRKSLIVFQFFIATVLVFLTIIVWKQIDYVKSRPPGYTTNGLVYFNSKDEGLLKHFDVFKNELIHSNTVVNVANSSAPVQQMNLSSGGFDWKGSGEKQNAIFGTTKISPEFANTVQWQFVHGRNFENNRPSDSAAIILNQAAADYMGSAAKLGQIINFREKDYTIVGIIKNPIMQGPFVNINPSVFFLNDEVQSYFTIRLNNRMTTSEELDKIQNIYHKYSPDYPLNLLFVDAKYGEAFLSINQSAKLISIFSILAIFIAVLGLYGLTAYAVEQKRKEIGIRKVLGASVIRLWNSFVKEFVLLLALSFIVAIPISLIIMRNWLASFDYRTEISPYLFLLGIILSLIFALIAISWKILKAVRMNPVKNLRVE